MLSKEKAIVLFSGGQDSGTCLAWALERYEHVETIAFDYGQRHSVELDCQKVLSESLKKIKPEWAARLHDSHLIDLKTLGAVSNTSLTRDMAIAEIKTDEGTTVPNTFVPGRNLIFLTYAAAVAYGRDIRHIITGVCETDFSGYPDCRDDTIKALQVALNLGMDKRFVLHTPLMWIDKASTWQLAEEIGGKALVSAIVEDSHTCYIGKRDLRHDWGYGCGTCPACLLRESGWKEYNSKKSA